MLWILKRTVSMRQFFLAPKTYVKNDRLENIYNFYAKIFCLSKSVVDTSCTKMIVSDYYIRIVSCQIYFELGKN